MAAAPRPDDLPEPHRDWLAHSASLWRRAHEIVNGSPGLDVGDVYHALRNLELPPAERLRRGLERARGRPHRR